jgi:hypothetical protein
MRYVAAAERREQWVHRMSASRQPPAPRCSDRSIAEANMNSVNDKVDSLHVTRVLRVFGLAAVLAFAVPAQSQECSGGNGGGTDATGNQCSDPVAVAESGAGHSAASLVSPPKVEQALLSNRAVVGTGTPATSSARTPDPSKSQMGAAAHRKQVFDERRARFNGSGHARVAEARAPVAAAP